MCRENLIWKMLFSIWYRYAWRKRTVSAPNKSQTNNLWMLYHWPIALTCALARFMLQTCYALLESEWQSVMLMHNDDVNEDGEFDAWCLSERSCYSVNDRGKLGEKELRVLQIGVEPTTLWLILWLLYHCAIIIVLATKKVPWDKLSKFKFLQWIQG